MYIFDSSVMRPDAILGRDLLNYKGIQICTDSQRTRLYFNNVQNIHNVAISTETVHTPLKKGWFTYVTYWIYCHDLTPMLQLEIRYRQ
jgi:hypothetical protein